MQLKGFRHATPNFNVAELSASSSVHPSELAADIVTENAVGVDFVRDIYGPWLVMTDDLQGELFFDHDRFVYYRPSNGLGYGIGKVELLDAGATGTAFTMQLESYTYQPTDTVVPQYGLRFDVTGMVKKVATKSSDYTTFSLVGVWRRVNRNNAHAALLLSQKNKHGVMNGTTNADSDSTQSRSAATGQFNAARLPLSGAEATLKPFVPNADLQNVFAHVFPTHLRADSHIKRAEQNTAAANLVGASATSASVLSSSSFSKDTAVDAAHIDLGKYAVGSIPGLYYIPDYISAEEEAQMLAFIRSTPQELKSKLTKRTVQEWGCTMCGECQKSFVSDANMPPWVQEVLDMQVYDGLFTPTTFPNSVRIHEYQQGEGIGPHCDGPIYVPMVTVLSLASSCLMSFYPRQGLYESHPMDHYNDTFKFAEGEIGQQVPLQSVVLEPRSLLIFSGEGYYHYPHGVSDKAQDDLSSDLVGEVVNRQFLRDKEVQSIPRTFRASITTRNLMTRCSHQPERAEYSMKRAWHIYHHLPVPQPLYTPPPLPVTTAETTTKKPQTSIGPLQTSAEGGAAVLSAIQELRADQEKVRVSVEELKQIVMAYLPAQQTFQSDTATILNHLSSTVLELDGKVEELMDQLAERSGNDTKE
jgi:alkylated DNA repair protein alkB homolog 6